MSSLYSGFIVEQQGSPRVCGFFLKSQKHYLHRWKHVRNYYSVVRNGYKHEVSAFFVSDMNSFRLPLLY